jgi:molybdopterin-containing oxidoreductase family iron-sulfur binding subunit
VGFPLLEGALDPRAGLAAASLASPAAAAGRQWAMVVDVEACLSAGVREACAEACHREHNVPSLPERDERVEWIWSERLEHVFEDQVHERTAPAALEAPVLVLCNHCANPSCVRVCPTGATWKRESDGIVMMDMHRCIGCRYCMAACPYGARSFNWRDPRPFVATGSDGQPASDYPTRTRGVVEKCTFCAERVREGREPACVEAARAAGAEGALVFGDAADSGSEVSRILRERTTLVRRPSLGNGPNVYYLLPETFPAHAGVEGPTP